jgi:hypothetical protein
VTGHSLSVRWVEDLWHLECVCGWSGVAALGDAREVHDRHITATERQVVPTLKAYWGKQLRITRLKLHQSQDEIGVIVGLRGPTVSRAENGRGSVDVFHRLARHYGVILEAGATR